MGVRITIKARSTLSQIPSLLRSEATRITNAGLRAGEAVAKRESPVRTGFLRSSIGVRMLSGSSGILEATANYAAHVNYGTRFMAGRPFMDAGVAAAREFIEREWGGFEKKVPRA